jgi:hypothetical protein
MGDSGQNHNLAMAFIQNRIEMVKKIDCIEDRTDWTKDRTD